MVLAAAAALTLSGCTGGDDEPTSTPTPSAPSAVTTPPASTSPSASSSATATPNPTASVVVPAAARAHTEAGAIAFASFFMSEADRAFVVSDSSAIEALSGPSCEGCQDTIKGVAEQKAAGQRQVKPSLTVLATNPLPGGTADALDVQVQVRSDAVDIVDRTGKKVNSTEKGQGVYRVAAVWANDRWTAADMGFER